MSQLIKVDLRYRTGCLPMLARMSAVLPSRALHLTGEFRLQIADDAPAQIEPESVKVYVLPFQPPDFGSPQTCYPGNQYGYPVHRVGDTSHYPLSNM